MSSLRSMSTTTRCTLPNRPSRVLWPLVAGWFALKQSTTSPRRDGGSWRTGRPPHLTTSAADGSPLRPGSLFARLAAATVLTGIGAGVGGGVLTLLLHLVQHVTYGYSDSSFQLGVQRASGQRRVVVIVVAGLVAGVGWWMLRRFAPAVPRVTDAITHRVRMPFGTLTIDAALHIVVVALGASLGREGAPRQFGAAAGAWLSDHAGLDQDHRRILIGCGAGAGLAAVYNVPRGGALFALEVLLASVTAPVVVAAVATSAIATSVAWLVLPNRPTYNVGSSSVSATIVAWSLLVGPLLGLAGMGFSRLTAYAAAHRPAGWRLLPTTLLIFPALGAVAVAYPQLLCNGKGPAQLAFDGTLSVAALAAFGRPQAVRHRRKPARRRYRRTAHPFRSDRCAPRRVDGARLGAALARCPSARFRRRRRRRLPGGDHEGADHLDRADAGVHPRRNGTVGSHDAGGVRERRQCRRAGPGFAAR